MKNQSFIDKNYYQRLVVNFQQFFKFMKMLISFNKMNVVV